MTDAAARTEGPAPRTILTPGDVVTHAQWPSGSPVRSLHVVRIGGAGMSAVARLALEADIEVSGSDSQDGQFIGPLREAGARIGIGFDADLLAEDLDLVVVSTAVRADNPEIIAAHRRGIPVVHRAAALAGLMGQRDLVAIAGTHGKTSTTGLAVMALRGAGLDPAWALGAAVPDLGRNAGLGAEPSPTESMRDGTGIAVIEADESDGSFLAFTPRSLVVTNLEPDHLDFHGDAATLQAGFDALTDRILPGGTLVVCADDEGARALGERAAAHGASVSTYGTSKAADWRVLAEDSGPDGTDVEVLSPRGPLRVRLAVAGHHNVLNALGALAGTASAAPDAPLEALADGLGRFTGASRRFDLAGVVDGITVIDDYAHHPREVTATIAAARAIVADQGAGGRVLAVFQPHLFSRTRDFAAAFAASLEGADLAWVMPVYPAREDPDPTVDARTITQHSTAAHVRPLDARAPVPSQVAGEARPGDLVLMLGAGDVVEDTPAVLQALRRARGTA
ncbi:UDP-N-acetylmuramate--L-alanine ligase [Brachybacterium sp. p3-SID957]|uniref:UDP-N-acetylmuramate--L-alanine ligase n=1 Tax=Brachybacterium sp. p3-SID957 TaxID=2916049 RepID=UPI00223B6035|nr:UDP-N-acetylmuramate--L-alanine ligase [Brachybacterium sp. p3-SID957]MCT1776582.1 UDP-N-acetylmuramate--L-alanine ligase [Brachybacterium sp. p3-SID957]